MSNRKAALIVGGALVLTIVVAVLCIGWLRQPVVTPAPYETPQPIQGEEGVDWEDCFNNEPDCFLGRRKLAPTVAPTSTKPATVRTTQPAPVRTTKRR